MPEIVLLKIILNDKIFYKSELGSLYDPKCEIVGLVNNNNIYLFDDINIIINKFILEDISQ